MIRSLVSSEIEGMTRINKKTNYESSKYIEYLEYGGLYIDSPIEAEIIFNRVTGR